MSTAVLQDFSSAFDAIDESILIQHLLTVFGFTDAVLQWFSSYMTDRTQYVSLSNQRSAFARGHSGVPQGTVLGPTLLTMYVKPSSSIHLMMTYDHRCLLPRRKYPSYFTLCSHVLVMSKLGQLRTCFNLMTARQNSCLSPPKELSISITYLLQLLSAMLKFS